MLSFIENIQQVFCKCRPYLATGISVFCYLVFPDQAYIPAAGAVLGVMIMDIISKLYALKKPYKSYIEALRAGAISSRAFFEGTKKKLLAFMYLMIMCGLSYRVAPISKVTVFLGTFVYSMMFLRECQSCIENLITAGHDLNWLLCFLRKKETNLKKENSDGKN